MQLGKLIATLALASCGAGAPSNGRADGATDGAVAGTVAAALGTICPVRNITEMCGGAAAANQGSPCDEVLGPCGGYIVWSIRWSDEQVDLCVYDAQTGKVVDALECAPATMNLCAAGLGCGAGPIVPTLPAACALPPDAPGCMNDRPVPT